MVDALSIASIEGWRVGSLYASTGGGYAPATRGALHVLLSEQVQLVLASGDASQGLGLEHGLHELAIERGAKFARLRPDAESWNEQLAG